ncbi:MAG: septal ring lytic transglycosylase RlpA family protein [Leptospiraceae bacterium]|nr:septal ring lytic transglycosylase RlpA family protein [Leptospiraceae bacterium]MCP5496234.1 septal ring lytic transglycosylase RlpA family protein [Leptospiraceae bacterium]
MRHIIVALGFVAFVTCGGTAQTIRTGSTSLTSDQQIEEGLASWYGAELQGKSTASGEKFDRFKLTAAHRTLPFGSVVKIRNLENGKESTVVVNDRGPVSNSRIIDVSEQAADELGLKEKGSAKVALILVKKGDDVAEKEELPVCGIDKNCDTEKEVTTTSNIPTTAKPIEESVFKEVGFSSWYGKQYQGKPTASGERFDRFKLTAAHRTLPFGSSVKVRNLENDKETVVIVNDRGPYNEGRVIDVSERAAEELNFKESNIAKVELSLLPEKNPYPSEFKTVKDEEDDIFFLDDDDNDEDSEFDDEPLPKKDSKKTTAPPKIETYTPKPSNTTTASTSSNQPRGYTVQVGVFSSKSNASKKSEMIKQQFDEKVFIFSRGAMYVVQIGDFSAKSDARNLADRMKSQGIDCFVPKTKN